MATTEPLLTYSDVFESLLEFVALFLCSGAIGFRLFVFRRSERTSLLKRADRLAALLGSAGALTRLIMLFTINLPALAERRHTTIEALLTSDGRIITLVSAAALALLGLILALVRIDAGWFLAGIGAIGGPLCMIFFGWNRAINPLHMLSGGLWIGTLFILVVAGLNSIARSELTSEERGAEAARMVHAFSPLALTAFAVLAFTGVNTAWRHLKRLDALCTTPYGYALIAKLVIVVIVIALGAWNWRRQKPLLGTEAATAMLRRSANAELIAASFVLIATAILVSLPSPD